MAGYRANCTFDKLRKFDPLQSSQSVGRQLSFPWMSLNVTSLGVSLKITECYNNSRNAISLERWT